MCLCFEGICDRVSWDECSFFYLESVRIKLLNHRSKFDIFYTVYRLDHVDITIQFLLLLDLVLDRRVVLLVGNEDVVDQWTVGG